MPCAWPGQTLPGVRAACEERGGPLGSGRVRQVGQGTAVDAKAVGPSRATHRWAPRPRTGASRRGCSRPAKTSTKTASSGRWGDRLEQRAALLITGPRRDTHQGLHVMGPLGWVQPARRCQKRRRLGEKDATSAPGSIWDSGSGVGPLVAVGRQGRAPSGQEALADIEAYRVGHDALLGAGAMSPSPCRCPLATVDPWQANIRMAACA
jgi:hypothetical protein